MSLPLIRLVVRELDRIADRRHLIRGISFESAGGELIALVGRNGAGKTTLLSTISGRRRPDGGSIEVTLDGVPLAGIALRAVVAGLGHDLMLYPDLTAEENLRFVADLHRVNRDRIAPALAEVGLQKAADRPVALLSRGLQQRCALARIRVIDPRIWILDEPTTGFDDPARKWFPGWIRGLTAKGNIVILSSHAEDEVARTSDRVLVMQNGRLVHDGPGGLEGSATAFARLAEGGA